MKDFAYAAPRSEEEVLDLLSSRWGQSELLAGGTDLLPLMKKFVVSPERVVNLKNVPSLRGIERDSQFVTLGATTTLEEILDSSDLPEFPSLNMVIRHLSMQLQSVGTLGGELCQRPSCWYFRNGQGLLANAGRLVEQGANERHAILGNTGPAKFVSASRLAPALIVLAAEVRVLGPSAREEQWLPLERLYRIPRAEGQREHVLQPNQFVTHVRIPLAGRVNGAYEVRHGEGPAYPLAAAAAALRIEDGLVREARICLGHVAPMPWFVPDAGRVLLGSPVTPELAAAAGEAAVAGAQPLSENEYKVQLARVSVKRAVLAAAGLETGGWSS